MPTWKTLHTDEVDSMRGKTTEGKREERRINYFCKRNLETKEKEKVHKKEQRENKMKTNWQESERDRSRRSLRQRTNKKEGGTRRVEEKDGEEREKHPSWKLMEGSIPSLNFSSLFSL